MSKKSTKAMAIVIIIGLVLSFGLVGCNNSSSTTTETKAKPTNLILATTTSTADTGLLDYLLPMFQKKYNVKVKTIAVGTGEAIAMGERGEADVLLVHSRAKEDAFMAAGNGAVRREVMYNDFVVIGPAGDPAGIKGKPVVDAFKAIAAKQSPFVNRGDASGTDAKEKGIWTKAAITPSGDWYVITGQGMGESTRIAEEKQAYILIDRGTYLSLKKTLSLVILVEGEKDLFNPYGVIVVSKEKFPKVNATDASRFANWITSEDVQKLIGEFGKDKYGQALFTPNAD